MWNMLKEAFNGEDGFTVIFYLNSGVVLNVNLSKPDWTSCIFRGITLIDENPVTIHGSCVTAYEIEY